MGLDMFIMKKQQDGMKEVMYLRKANQIHNYFVETFADGVDECQEIPISVDDIQALRDLCQDVIDNSPTEPAWIEEPCGWVIYKPDEELEVYKPDGLKAVLVGKKQAKDLAPGDLYKTGEFEWYHKVVKVSSEEDVRSEEVWTTVCEVIKDTSFAESNLPTRSGFFFGSTSYDQYYLEDLKSYIEQADKIIKEHQDGDEYIYRASW